MADNYGLKNLIGNSSDQFKSDFINKINQALKKLDGIGYSSPVSATGEPVGMSVASPKKAGTTAAAASDISDVAYAMEAPKAKKEKEEKIEKILGDKSIYAKAVNNKKVEDEMQKAIEENNQRALDFKEATKIVPSTIAKDAIRDAKTQKYADEQIGKQYDKDMEKWLQYVVSTEDADQDLADYANWIQGVLNGTGFSKYKKEKLRDGLQGLINTLIYEDEDKTTVDAAKGVSDYVAGGTHASASDNKINEALQAIQTLKEMRDIILKEKLGGKEDNDLYL